MDVTEHLAAWLAEHRVPAPGVPVVVGCSGGADSTTLLDVLARAGRGPLHAVYIDHGLRPGTEREAEVVAGIAAAIGATTERIAVVVERRGNLLAQARRARYRALAEVAHRLHAPVVAVGHTATDQAETVMFRALRGDLPQSLAGMPARRPLAPGVELVRPLLAVRRVETAAWVAARGLPVVHDPTNDRPDLARTRIRQYLSAAGEAERSLTELAAVTASWVSACEQAAQVIGPLARLSVPAVAAAGPDVALRLLRRAGLHRAGAAHVSALLRLVSTTDGSRSIDLGGGLVAERCYDNLRLGAPVSPGPTGDRAGVAPLPFHGPGLYPWSDGEILVADESGQGDLVWLDPTREGLCLRHLLPGDRLRTRVGRRKLQDVLTDRKVPRDERRRIPLLCAGGEVLWVGGLGLAAWPGALPEPPGARTLHPLRLAFVPTGEQGKPAC